MIHKIKISKFKVLENIEKDIQGKNIMLIGDNGVGKSSLMQFIKIALGDTDIVPPEATGDGELLVEQNGKKYLLNVKFKSGKPIITIIGEDGLSDTRKGTLAQIFGAMDFDVNEFVEWSKSEKGQKLQVEKFKSFLPEDVKNEINRLESNVASAYEDRTECNKDVKRLEGSINLNPLRNEIHLLNDLKQINVSELQQKEVVTKAKLNLIFKENQAKNAELRKTFDEQKESERKRIDVFNISQDNLTSNIKLADESLSNLISIGYPQSETLQHWISQLPKPQPKEIFDAAKLPQPKLVDEMPDSTELNQIRTQITEAGETNRKYDAVQILKKQIRELEDRKTEAGELTAKIESQRQAISDAVKDMSNVIDGLTFDEKGLVYKGVPVNSNSLSTSEIIELGIKMSLAANPKSDIIFIPNSNLIGAERWNTLLNLAKEMNMQIIAEEVVRGVSELKIQIIGE